MSHIRVVGMYTKTEGSPGVVVNTTSHAGWSRDLSPFFVGPCNLYNGLVATNLENCWQYSKLYQQHADADGNPTPAYWTWAQQGWSNPKAVRYPMGKGKKPLCSLWELKSYPVKLDYIGARKYIYGPLYAEAVQKTKGWTTLKKMYEDEDQVTLRDYDGYDYAAMGMTLTDVLNNPKKKCGHAFILAMLLLNDPALSQMDMR